MDTILQGSPIVLNEARVATLRVFECGGVDKSGFGSEIKVVRWTEY